MIVARLVHDMASGRAVGDDLADAEHCAELAEALCWFVPECLRWKYPEWRWESLDGIELSFIRVSGKSELELAGNCILITDQTWTAIYVKLRSFDPANGVDWIDCRVGEVDEQTGEMIQDIYGSDAAIKRRLVMKDRLDDIRWKFRCVVEPS